MKDYDIHIDDYKPLCCAEFYTDGVCILEEFWWTNDEKATAWVFNHGGDEKITINFYVLYVKEGFR